MLWTLYGYWPYTVIGWEDREGIIFHRLKYNGDTMYDGCYNLNDETYRVVPLREDAQR